MKRALAVAGAALIATWAALFVPAPWGIRDVTIPTCAYGVTHGECVNHTLTRCVYFYMPGVSEPYAADCREVKP